MRMTQENNESEVLAQYIKDGYSYETHVMPLKNFSWRGWLSWGIGIPFGIFTCYYFQKNTNYLPVHVYSDDPLASIKVGLMVLGILIGTQIICAPIHELLHAIGFLPSCKWKWKGNVQIRFLPKKGMAYCHCRIPLKWTTYLIGSLLPFLVLGMGLLSLGIIWDSKIVIFVALCNIISCIGDFYIIYSLLRYKPELALDSQSAVGFIALNKRRVP